MADDKIFIRFFGALVELADLRAAHSANPLILSHPCYGNCAWECSRIPRSKRGAVYLITVEK